MRLPIFTFYHFNLNKDTKVFVVKTFRRENYNIRMKILIYLTQSQSKGKLFIINSLRNEYFMSRNFKRKGQHIKVFFILSIFHQSRSDHFILEKTDVLDFSFLHKSREADRGFMVRITGIT